MWRAMCRVQSAIHIISVVLVVVQTNEESFVVLVAYDDDGDESPVSV